MRRTLVLGAGFGGIAVAARLREQLHDQHEVLLVDRADDFVMGLRKLWALVGIGTLDEGRRSRTRLEGHGVVFAHHDILRIDAPHHMVETEHELLEGDSIVVALGAEPRPDLVPGLAENAHDLYDMRATPALQQALARFDGGHIAIVIAGAPYKCPPAPYECAMLIDADLRARGIRERTTLTVTTLQPMLMPNAGRDGSAWLAGQLEARGIAHAAGRKVERVEPDRVVFEGGDTLDANLIIGVPPHRPPAVVAESGLTGDGDWIRVDPGTLKTPVPHVFAIGDVTQITLANGLPLPKAGIFAELEGEHVADTIVADVRGQKPPPPFDGRGYCFIEMGPTEATLIEGDFFARPEPRIQLRAPSAENRARKHGFETERLRRWFGG